MIYFWLAAYDLWYQIITTMSKPFYVICFDYIIKYIPYDNTKYQSLINNTQNTGGSRPSGKRGLYLFGSKRGFGYRPKFGKQIPSTLKQLTKSNNMVYVPKYQWNSYECTFRVFNTIYSNIPSRHCDVMANVFVSSAVDLGFEHLVGQTKDFSIGICTHH